MGVCLLFSEIHSANEGGWLDRTYTYVYNLKLDLQGNAESVSPTYVLIHYLLNKFLSSSSII